MPPSGEDLIEADKNFHRTFFELLGSQLLSNPPGALRDAYCTLHISIDIGIKDESNLHLAEITQASRDPFEEVKAGNKSLASELLNRHFDGFREQLASFNASEF